MQNVFTIITPTILRPCLVDTCNSIDAQHYSRWQHIVAVDIPAREITLTQQALIDSIQHPNRSVIYCETSHRNFGNKCRHEAFKHVVGDYLLYMDDDDIYLSEAFEILDSRISDEVWGVFPIERFGVIFFNLPPRMCHTCGIQFLYKPLYPWPDNDAYCADGELIDFLRDHHPYLIIDSEPLARVVNQGKGE